MSASYLSDLLKRETGRNAQQHIHQFIIERAKTQLLNSNDQVSLIAYGLGFDYPQHFSKLLLEPKLCEEVTSKTYVKVVAEDVDIQSVYEIEIEQDKGESVCIVCSVLQ